jgi:hypothetical protein
MPGGCMRTRAAHARARVRKSWRAMDCIEDAEAPNVSKVIYRVDERWD